MNWVTGVMVYLVIWWTVLFAILPFGVKQWKIRSRPGPRRAGAAATAAQGRHYVDRGGGAMAGFLRSLHPMDIFSFRD